MKISELTENDVIHIRNKKEAKSIAELCEGWFNPALNEYGNIAVNRAFENYGSETCIKKNIASGYNNETYVTYGSVAYYSQDGKNIIPASKFLKQSISKKDLQEALSKVSEELSSMNERLGKLEAKNEPSQTANGIEVHFDEVTEGLPERWAIKPRDKEELRLIYNKVCVTSEAKDLEYYYHFPATDGDNNWAHWSIQNGYTEITFETFKKYVLKEEVKEAQTEAIDFSKAGQLVKSGDIIVYTDGSESPETFGGTRLESEIGRKGHYSKNWVKSFFTLCTEPVTLKN